MINGSVELEWGDGTYIFNVAKIAQALELEELCGTPENPMGIFEILGRLTPPPGGSILDIKAGKKQVREVIRIGLIGGGKTPIQALTLTKRYVDDRPLVESVLCAQNIVLAAIVGVPGDDVGKKPEAEGTEKEATPASSAPPSTDSGQQLGSLLDKLTKSPSGSFAPA